MSEETGCRMGENLCWVFIYKTLISRNYKELKKGKDENSK
jgi:hypothetical protein